MSLAMYPEESLQVIPTTGFFVALLEHIHKVLSVHNFSNVLVLMRGLPGMGKSTLCSGISEFFSLERMDWLDLFKKQTGIELSNVVQSVHFEADQWFDNGDGTTSFNGKELPLAHLSCLMRTTDAMHELVRIILVSNTFVDQNEMDMYFGVAKSCKYSVITVDLLLMSFIEAKKRLTIFSPDSYWASLYEYLASRNVHGVSLTKIKNMRQKYVLSQCPIELFHPPRHIFAT